MRIKIKKETSILRRITNIGMCTFFYHCYFFLVKRDLQGELCRGGTAIMAWYSEEQIEQVRQRSDIVEVI